MRLPLCLHKYLQNTRRKDEKNIRFIHATYNMLHNSIDVTTFDGYILRIDCSKAEEGLKIIPCSFDGIVPAIYKNAKNGRKKQETFS